MCLVSSNDIESNNISNRFWLLREVSILNNPLLLFARVCLSKATIPTPVFPIDFNVSEIYRELETFLILSSVWLL